MAGWSNSTRKATLPADWERRRRRVKRRAGGRCECDGTACGRDHLDGRCLEKGTDCDHKGDRLDHRDSNLQWLCSDCHDLKTVREREADRPRIKPRTKRHPGLL